MTKLPDTAQRERRDKRLLNDRSDEYNGSGTIDDYMARQRDRYNRGMRNE